MSIQRQPYYDIHVERAFAAACGDGKPCTGVSLSGFAGSDLFTRWEMAIDKGLKKFPNVQIVSRREAKFDPRLARQITQDALQAHPDLNFVVCHDDNMSLGVASAIKAAGLVPGKDVKIYSMGGNAHGVQGVKDGIFEWTAAEDPQAEAYYGAIALVMALEGKPLNGYVNLEDLPWLVDGTDTIFITKENIEQVHAALVAADVRRRATKMTELPAIRIRGLGKSFPGVAALRGVDLDIYQSEVHALVGENGAGKSTLIQRAVGRYAAGRRHTIRTGWQGGALHRAERRPSQRHRRDLPRADDRAGSLGRRKT